MSIKYCEVSEDNRRTIHVAYANAPGLNVEHILHDLNVAASEFHAPTKQMAAGHNRIMCQLDNGMVWLCIADLSFPRSALLKFISEILASIDVHSQSAAYQIGSQMAEFNERNGLLGYLNRNGLGTGMTSDSQRRRSVSPARAAHREPAVHSKVSDRLIETSSNLEEAKVQLLKTTEILMERGEKLDDLLDATEDLAINGGLFQKEAHKVQRKLYCKNKCCCIGIWAAGITIVSITIILICVLTKK